MKGGGVSVLGVKGVASDWDLIEVSNPTVLREILSRTSRVTIRRGIDQPQKGSGPSVAGPRTYPKEPDPVLVLPGLGDLYSLAKVSSSETTLHMLLPIPTVRAVSEEVAHLVDAETMSSGTSTSACLVSEIVTFRTAKPTCSDLFALYHWLCQQTRNRAHVWTLPGNDSFTGVTVEELLNAPVPVSGREALNDFFQAFPILVVPPLRTEGSTAETRIPWGSYELIPLDESADLADLADVFVRNLRVHLREFGETERESLQEFSLFNAIFVLERSCAEIDLGLSALNIEGSDAVAVQSYTADLLARPVCAYQVLRYFATSVKNGFEFVVAPNPDNSAHFLDSISGLEMATHGMHVTHKFGVRLTVSLAKMILLRGVPRLKSVSHTLHPDSLVKYHYGRNAVGPLSLASLIEVEPAVELTICSVKDMLSAFSEIMNEVLTEGLGGTTGQRFLSLQNAIYAERDFHSSGNASEPWVPWNWRISPINETTRLMLLGLVTGKRMLSEAYESFKLINMEKQDCWLPMLLAGRAFVCGLPENLLECLDEMGRLKDGLAPLSDTIAAFVVGCDSRRLRWQWLARLTTLYKICPLWPREILFEYMSPTLSFDGAPTFEEIASMYLKPCMDSPLLAQVGLCLEHTTQR